MSKTLYLESLPPPGARPRGVLLLLHAFPLNSLMWTDQLQLSSGGWRVIAPDFRGTNGGSVNTPVSSMDDHAGDIVDLLDMLHIQDAVVVGLSMGGYAAFALLRLAPNYLRGLVLADTRAEADTPQSIEGRTRMLRLIEEQGTPAVADEMLPKLLSAAALAERPALTASVRGTILKNSSESVAAMVRATMTRPDSTRLLPTIRCPTLIVVGSEDGPTPPAASEKMRAGIPGAELVVIPGAGHLSNLEQPAVFNAAVEEFLQKRI